MNSIIKHGNGRGELKDPNWLFSKTSTVDTLELTCGAVRVGQSERTKRVCEILLSMCFSQLKQESKGKFQLPMHLAYLQY